MKNAKILVRRWSEVYSIDCPPSYRYNFSFRKNNRVESYDWDYEFCEADVVIPDYFETNADLYDNLRMIDDCKIVYYPRNHKFGDDYVVAGIVNNWTDKKEGHLKLKKPGYLKWSNAIYNSTNVCDSDAVDSSDNIHVCDAVNHCFDAHHVCGGNDSKNIKTGNGINKCSDIMSGNGINESRNVDLSCGVNESKNVDQSTGINRSCDILQCAAIDRCFGVYNGYGAYDSYKIVNSRGVCECFAVRECNGIYKSAFCYRKSGSYKLFNKRVTKERISNVLWDLRRFETQIESWHKSWYEMPDELKKYIKSLPEYDAKIFKKITGVEL